MRVTFTRGCARFTRLPLATIPARLPACKIPSYSSVRFGQHQREFIQRIPAVRARSEHRKDVVHNSFRVIPQFVQNPRQGDRRRRSAVCTAGNRGLSQENRMLRYRDQGFVRFLHWHRLQGFPNLRSGWKCNNGTNVPCTFGLCRWSFAPALSSCQIPANSLSPLGR
jgi:hypothetical protein